MKIKKLKKVIAGMLSAAMVMSTMAVTAFAQTTPATIDESKRGSLTIHKYEYNGDEEIPGTGEEGNQTPSDAKPLKGAGFTIYKVVDLDGMTAYYDKDPESLPSVDEYVDSETGAIKEEFANTKVGNQIVTGTNGIAAFTNLDLGFYVVIETQKPDSVTDPVDPFIVSIPMTTVDGDDWLYDVHVYPKNGTTYGGVTLKKTGEDNVALAGVRFALQKEEGENNWIDITKQAGAGGDNTGDDLNLVTNGSGVISVSGLTQGTYRFIETDLGNNGGYIMDGKTAYTFTVNADGSVTYGGTTGPTIEIEVKNEQPDMTKEVQDRTDKTWGQDSDYNVGDTIPYKVTIDVPKNITSLKKFVLTDTPTNLIDNVDSIKVLDGENEVPANVYSKVAAGNGFTITFNTANMAAYADKELTVTYNAVLQSSAVTTTAGNPNTASLEYSNEILPDQGDEDNPNVPDNPEEEPGSAFIEDNAVVYTFKLSVHKTGQDGLTGEKPLEDVTFDLYKEVPQGTEGAVQGNSDNGLDSKKYWLRLDTLTTDDSGNVSKSGLANGTYYLVETKTNDGYNLLKSPVEVVLNIQYTTSMTQSWQWTQVDGTWKLVKHVITVENTTFSGNDTTTPTDGNVITNIVNKKGFTLPTTGGAGTLLASLIGILLMGGGAFVFISSRKRKSA